MKSIRLLPIVVFAAGALLVLKVAGLVLDGGYSLSGIQIVAAQDAPVAADDAADAGTETAGQTATSSAETALSQADIDAANEASESLFSRASPAPLNSKQLDAVPYTLNKAGEKIALTTDEGGSETEQAVLERLSERRAELDRLERELATRQNLLEAAEQRLNERIAGLEAVEQRINAQVEARKAQDAEQFQGLVSMYESMKSKDAAAIFDQLEMETLLRVAIAMNPRKMSPILADMSREKAKELTLAMAVEEAEPKLDEPEDAFADLPQIVGQ